MRAYRRVGVVGQLLANLLEAELEELLHELGARARRPLRVRQRRRAHELGQRLRGRDPHLLHILKSHQVAEHARDVGHVGKEAGAELLRVGAEHPARRRLVLERRRPDRDPPVAHAGDGDGDGLASVAVLVVGAVVDDGVVGVGHVDLGVGLRAAQQRRHDVRQVGHERVAQALADPRARLQHERRLRVVGVERAGRLRRDHRLHHRGGVLLELVAADGEADERDALHRLAAQHPHVLALRRV